MKRGNLECRGSGSNPVKGMIRSALLILMCPALLAALASFSITPDIKGILDHISPDSLRGHVSFLASELLQGRCTPSPGGDIAAQYIAAQFRSAGLQLAGDDGYFQTANWRLFEQSWTGFELRVEHGEQTFLISKDRVGLQAYEAQDLSRAPIVKIDLAGDLKAEQLRGKVVGIEISTDESESQRQYVALWRRGAELMAAKPALVLHFLETSGESWSSWWSRSRLEDPDEPQPFAPPIEIVDPDLFKLFKALKPGPTNLTVSLHLPPPSVKEVKLRNVIGLLPGSDPVLKDSYVLVTAHYDHLSEVAEGKNSGVLYGANDDASGTASVIELASAMAKLKARPKRSIVFLTFFGEEKILLGSRYYVRHPVFPLSKTVADINLEHLGRTDASEGAQLNKLSFTGFDYSDLTATFQAAGAQAGIQVYKHDPDSDRWFRRSDNETLADMGVVAHTAHVTFGFADYHKVDDQWQKIDYENMAKVNRAIALVILMIADNPEAPRWDAANPKAERYCMASKSRPASLPTRHPWPWYLTGCMGNR